jgi:hypothetical protein
MNDKPMIRTGQQRVEDALAALAAEQRQMRERLELVMLAAGLVMPDYAPEERDPFDTEDVYTT